MRLNNRALLLSALVLPLSISAAYGADPVDTSKLPKVECSALKFSSTFLDKYPDAPAACLEAREVDGKRYARFDAKVYISDPAFMTVQLLNVHGTPLSSFSFKPGKDQMIKINGKPTKFDELRVGEKISFWVSEDRLTASELPGSTEESWAVLPPLKKP